MPKYDSPSYQVISTDKKIEVRHYETFYTSKVNEASLSGNSGFRVLFSYISGSNEKDQKISMTIPVINELEDEQSMEFVVPKEFYDDIPNPTDARVSIKKHPEQTVVVYKFSGRIKEKKVRNSKAFLQDWITKHDYEKNGPYILARYNPPITPGFLRRNELMVKVK